MNSSTFITSVMALCIALILVAACTAPVEPDTPAPVTVSPTPPPVDVPDTSVNFLLDPGTPESCGLTCRQATATVTNTGNETAHNVCVALSVSNSRGERIFLNNRLTLQRCIGDLAGGESQQEPITINADCGAFGTRCIGQTLFLRCRVTSDEKTRQFPDQVMAL
ncbi:MAG: hypothetical protein WC406_03620 [Methanoregula sp.]|nr:hypothetical protein [Methanoregula sp.]